MKKNSIIVANQSILVQGVTFEMIYVEGGSFDMGCTSEQSDFWDDEQPAHRVSVSSFYIGKYEVTQLLWRAVMGTNPSFWQGDDLPVERVSWEDCQEFIGKLNKLTGKHFRLPTESEWEYASRGGNKSQSYQYAGSHNLMDVGWYWDNSSGHTHEVGLKRPNALGLYDMSGNVWEWCGDWYDASYYGRSAVLDPQGASSGSTRVIRGGSWAGNAQGCRVAIRSYFTPDYRYLIGFRLSLVQ